VRHSLLGRCAVKVHYKSKDGTYESTAYLDEDIFDGAATPARVTGVDKYTDEPVTLTYDTYGWREI